MLEPQYSGLVGKVLSPKGRIENYPTDFGNENSISQEFKLKQNYPHPFNPATNISYTLSAGGNVFLTIYDFLGRQVALLVMDIKVREFTLWLLTAATTIY